MTRIAILGLGAMGFRMAERLLEQKHDLIVYNRSQGRAQPLKDKGARVAETPRAAAKDADVVISMVTNDEASNAVWLDDATGALQGLKSGAIAIESSTLTPSFMKSLGQKIESKGAAFLDAPVVGSRPQTEAGQLVYLIGGKADVLAQTKDVLSSMAGAIHHVGPIGHGTVMKLVVNGMFGIQITAVAELMGMAERAGISLNQSAELLSAMAVTSPAIKVVSGLIAKGVFGPMFPIDLVEKDFGYIMQAAHALGASTPTTQAAREVYQNAQRAGFGEDNIHGVAKLYLKNKPTP